jgi:nucleoid DNA-binding protein
MGADMTNHDCVGELAGLLDVERQVASSFLIDFSSAMVAELLAVRKLSLKGLGSFTVTHHPAEKKSTASAIVYTPPCNRLIFSTQVSGGDDTVRLAVSRLSMSPTDAERFAGGLAALFSGAVQQQREIRLTGIGRFALEQGRYGFLPERSLEELLNREYQDLQEVVLPQHEPVQDKKEGETGKKLRYILPLSLFVLVALLLGVFFVMQPKAVVSLSTEPQPVRIERVADHSEKLPAVVHRSTAPHRELSAPVRSAGREGANDSLVLAQESYTIVLVTFRKEETIRKEVARFRSEGIKAFVWPAYQKNVKYYRLITGDFSDRNAAVERIGRMTEKNAGNAYIQHVIKRVVLHGEKGL